MAKKSSKGEALRVALILDLDDYEKGLAKARGDGVKSGEAVNAGLGKSTDSLLIKFLSVERAISLGTKAVKAFAREAERLEKAGTGTEGTKAAIALEKSISMLWETFVRFTLAIPGVSGALGAAADGIDLVSAALRIAQKETGGWKTSLSGLVEAAIQASGFDEWAAPSAAERDFDLRRALGQGGFSGDHQGFMARAKFRDKYSPKTDPDADRLHAMKETLRKEREEAAGKEKYDKFLKGSEILVNAFASSWEGGFARIGKLFKEFPDEAAKAMGDMSKNTALAFGEIFDSIAFTGPLLQRVFGQSEDAAKKFAAAQLAVTGAMAVVNAAMSLAKASDELAGGKFGAAAGYLAAAAGYTTAAALAGVAAYQTLAGGASSGGVDNSSGILNSDRYAERRKNITVVVQNAIGGEQFVRDQIIPEINRAVGEDVVVLSSYATAAATGRRA